MRCPNKVKCDTETLSLLCNGQKSYFTQRVPVEIHYTINSILLTKCMEIQMKQK